MCSVYVFSHAVSIIATAIALSMAGSYQRGPISCHLLPGWLHRVPAHRQTAVKFSIVPEEWQHAHV